MKDVVVAPRGSSGRSRMGSREILAADPLADRLATDTGDASDLRLSHQVHRRAFWDLDVEELRAGFGSTALREIFQIVRRRVHQDRRDFRTL